MLAKELKIKNIKKQREWLKKHLLETIANQEDGDCTIIYIGQIFPEVIKYFEDEGFIVTPINTERILAQHKGMPTYRFTIGDIVLSKEELNQDEEYELSEEDKKSENMELFGKAFGALLKEYDDLY